MKSAELGNIQLIAINKINVVNPRMRSRRHHLEIVESIRLIGLKRPITVRRREVPKDGCEYDLVCGQGRLEAFKMLDQSEIWASVVDITDDQCLVMSLVENIARRNRSPLEQMKEIDALRQRNYSNQEIAEKIGVTESWVIMIGGLLDRGEGRLLSAVDNGLIPVSLAVDISRSSTHEIQDVLTRAYERGEIQGKKITILRNLLDKREMLSKTHAPINVFGRKNDSNKQRAPLDLQKLYKEEIAKDLLMSKRADFAKERLAFVAQSFKELKSDKKFVELLKSQNLDKLPQHLMSLISKEDHHE